ncbi:MAG: hypothetical protein K0R26_939 [Bacteroidota bacterium]|jgi:hypothetical protein|nr:hypothetical protein [Bacteroidota bacterium]
MKKVLMVIFLAVAGVGNTLMAQQPKVVVSDKTGWHKIGETTVKFEKEKDEVVIMGADKFASLKFKVTDASIDLISADVYYDNGTSENIDIRTPLKVSGETKVFNIKGGEHDLKKVVLVYKTLPNSKDEKAHVEIWGLKTNADKNNKK